ncbi:MAG: calcium-binding protein, partial [Vogesella sp.]|uniref:calcium-binding protein n=1 Tax=Vogesella sp. TaxID=1904252 RepID=UPI003F2B32D3
HINVSNVAEDVAALQAGMGSKAAAKLDSLITADEALDEGVITNTAAGKANDANNFGDRLFRFLGVENLIGGSNSDVFVFANQAAITNSLYGGPTRGVGVSGGNEKAGARNILDLSQYNSGVRINESGGAYTIPAAVKGPLADVPSESRFTNEAAKVTVRGFHTMIGGAGDDVLVGDASQNVILGMKGSDVLVGMEGNDLLVADTLKMKESGKLVELVSGKPAWELLPSRTWTWYGTTIQNAKLGDLPGAQVLIGGLDSNDGNDVLMGSSGADRFYTGGGDDTVVGDFGRLAFEARGELKDGDASQVQSTANGGGGNDTIVGLNGNHVVLGGLGQDSITLGNGNSLVLGDLGSFTLKSDTRLTLTAQTSVGNSFDENGATDTITLGSGSNVVIAGAGADSVSINDAAGSRNVVLGDSGQVVFGSAKKDAHLLQSVDAQVRETTGAADSISLQSGNAVLAGG